MSRLINSTAMTVDAVIDVSDWFVAEGDHDDAARSVVGGSDAMLLGRKTFEGLASYWPSASGPWAEALNPMTKYVASRSSLSDLPWNGIALEGDALESVRRLKGQVNGDLFMSGCGELARELIQAGLVDEMHFWLHPTIKGAGGRPYEAATIKMRLLEARSFDSGVTWLRYAPQT